MLVVMVKAEVVVVMVEVMGRGLRRLFLWGLGHGFDFTLFVFCFSGWVWRVRYQDFRGVAGLEGWMDGW